MSRNQDWESGLQRLTVYNDSGEEIPAYACMELDLAFESGKSATEVVNDDEYRFQVKKPTTDAADNPSLVLFNDRTPIPIDTEGSAVVSPIFLAMFDDTDGAVTPGDTVGPQSNTWYLTKNGTGFKCKTLDSAQAGYVSASIRTIVVQSEGGGAGSNIYEYLLETDWSSSPPTATAKIYDASGTLIAAGQTIKDRKIYMDDQAAGDEGHCYKEGDTYYAIQAPCTGSGTSGGGTTLPPVNPVTYSPGSTI